MQFINWLVLVILVADVTFNLIGGGIDMSKKKSKSDKIATVLGLLVSGAINVYTIVWLITHNFV